MTSVFCCNRTSYISLYQKTFSNVVFWDPLSAVKSRFNKAVSFYDQNSGWKLFRIGWYPDNWPSRKIAPRWNFGFGSRLGLALGLGGNKTIVPEENCPWLGFALGLVLALGGAIFVGGNYSRKFPEIFKHSIPTKLNQLAIKVER